MTCPYCGHRDTKPGEESCASCDVRPADPQPPHHSPRGSSLWSARRHRNASWFYWRGEWRNWGKDLA